MSIIMMWLEGYYTDENEDAVVDSARWSATPRIFLFIAAIILTTTSSPPRKVLGK